MRFLLDENFPLRLHSRLQAEGIDCDHVIALGLRGIRDAEIVQRLAERDLVLLTQDREFEDLPIPGGKVVISRLPQNLPIERRVTIWMGALRRFVDAEPEGSRFEITEEGRLERLPE